jgi:hypothetical protein
MIFASTTSILQRKVNNIHELRGLDDALHIVTRAAAASHTSSHDGRISTISGKLHTFAWLQNLHNLAQLATKRTQHPLYFTNKVLNWFVPTENSQEINSVQLS